MDPMSHIKVSDARIQALKLNFTFNTEEDKLVIKAVSEQNIQKAFIGEIAFNPYVNFQLIKQMIQQGDYKTLIINQTLIKIRIGATIVQLLPKQNSEIKELKEKLQKSLQKQSQFENIIKSQQKQMTELKNQFNDLKETVQQLKQNPKQIQTNMQKIQEKIKEEISDALDNILSEKQTVFENFKNDIQEVKKNLRGLQQKLILIMVQFQNSQERQCPNKSQIKDCQNQIAVLKIQFQEFLENLNKQDQKIHSDAILQKNVSKNSSKLPYLWSNNLKGNDLQVYQNIVSTIYNTKQQILQFCLLEVGFTRQVKQKQSWSFKINNQSRYLLRVGMCLRNIIIKNDFDGHNFKWGDNNHGAYVMDSGGWVYSHSQKQFRNTKVGFSFGKGDVVTMEYDPVGLIMKYSKNKNAQVFVYKIIPPPQNDAYHPCVCLYQNNNDIQPHEVEIVSMDIKI